MVSLGDSSRRSGGYFFDHDSGIHYNEDEPLMTMEPVSVEQPSFNALPTVRILVTHLVLLILAEIFIIVLPIYCKSTDCGLTPYSWVALTQSIMWILFLSSHFHFSHHLDKIRLRGYLDFYRRFYRVKWVTLLILATGCATMSAASVIILNTCEHVVCSLLQSVNIDPVVYAQIILSSQCVFLIPFYIFQIRRSYRFHSRRYPPDAQREELAPSDSFRDSMFSEIGFRGGGEDHLEDIMERQLDVIRYLKQHNAILSRKIIQLSEQNDHLTRRIDEQRAFHHVSK